MNTLRGDGQDLYDVCEVVVGRGASLVCRRRMDSRARSVMRIPATVSHLAVPILIDDQQNAYDM